MEHFVTLFDARFLPQGLALHASLERHAGPYVLWVLCMDDAAHEALGRLQLPNVRTIRLAEVETPELLAVKPGRSRGEYCWTLTPFTPRIVFDRDPTARRATYVDADVWFRRDPASILAALDASGKSVLITEHAYAPGFDQTAVSGRFCVQFITFTRDGGEPVRQCWADRCIEWCFSRVEDGKFGDQMYLDRWPSQFGDAVHVLEHPEWMQGPWNTDRFTPETAVGFHFHGLRLLRGQRVLLTDVYPLYAATRSVFYDPYLDDLRGSLATLARIGMPAPVQVERPVWRVQAAVTLKGWLLALHRAVLKAPRRIQRLS